VRLHVFRKIVTTAMAQKHARLIVLGSKDFEGFTELDGLPAGMEIVGLGSADEILGDFASLLRP
jgi:hypothetical protein